MDDLLADMRSAESYSHENAWPTKFTKKTEKQVSTYETMTIINDKINYLSLIFIYMYDITINYYIL